MRKRMHNDICILMYSRMKIVKIARLFTTMMHFAYITRFAEAICLL